MTNLSDCIFCSKALQCPDGRLRYPITNSQTIEICGEFESRHKQYLK